MIVLSYTAKDFLSNQSILRESQRWTKQQWDIIKSCTPAVNNPVMCLQVLFTAEPVELEMWGRCSVLRSFMEVFSFQHIKYLFPPRKGLKLFNVINTYWVFLSFQPQLLRKFLFFSQCVDLFGDHLTPKCCCSRGCVPPATAGSGDPPTRGKHVPINRAERETGQQQNDRHLYYKPQ